MLGYSYMTPHSARNLYWKQTQADPVLLRVRFTLREDLIITKLVKEQGKKWENFVQYFEFRDDVMLRNRYYSFINKKKFQEKMYQIGREIER